MLAKQTDIASELLDQPIYILHEQSCLRFGNADVAHKWKIKLLANSHVRLYRLGCIREQPTRAHARPFRAKRTQQQTPASSSRNCFPATTEARSDTHSLLRLRILGLNQIQWHCHVNYTSTCSGSPHLHTAFNICAIHMIWQIANAIHFVPIEREAPGHVRDFWQQVLAESAQANC